MKAHFDGVRSLLGYAAVLVFLGGMLTLPNGSLAQVGVKGWMGYGGNPQHTAVAPVATTPLKQILWSTPVDLQPQYSGSDLLIHYGTPLITKNNTVIVTVKTGAGDGFQVEGHKADTGEKIWTQTTDYSLPPHGWTPSCGCTLTPDNRLVIPGAGGTVTIRTNPDQPNGAVTQVVFYGQDIYVANKATYDTNVKISTPITSDSKGNLYFGYLVLGATPSDLKSGLARISSTGVGSVASVATMTGDVAANHVVMNCTPALSNDETLVYTAVSVTGDRFGTGYLVALNSTTLAPSALVRLKDVHYTNLDSLLPDDGTATPMVGPDDDVYFGVLENPFFSNHLRGWLLHFNKDLSQSKLPGAFGWDDTASLVPTSAVPSYKGTSAYLLLTKYNNYVEGGGTGVNRVAVVDPNVSMADPISGMTVMQEVMTLAGPSPDLRLRDANHPNAVREWCINTAAVDPFTKSALVNNEDGKLYRWDFTTNAVSETVVLTSGIGEAYTPTITGPDGTVYAINNATLFAVGYKPVSVSGKVTLEDCVAPSQLVTFEFRPVTGGAVPFTRSQVLSATGAFTFTDVPSVKYNLAIKGAKWLQKVVAVNASSGSVIGVTATLPGGDANNDNVCGLDDLGMLADAFDTKPGDTLWDDSADLNCDGQVNLDDLGLLALHFDEAGDP